MNLKFKADHETKIIKVYNGTDLLAELKGEEMEDFLENISIFQKETSYFLDDERSHFGIKEIEEAVDSMDNVLAIHFGIQWNYEDADVYPESFVQIIRKEEPSFKNGYTLEEDLGKNFSIDRIMYGSFTNHELRSCMTNDLVEYIETAPKFLIYVNKKKVNLYDFFDDEKTVHYKGCNIYDY